MLVQSDEAWQIYTRTHPAGSGGSHGYTAQPHTRAAQCCTIRCVRCRWLIAMCWFVVCVFSFDPRATSMKALFLAHSPLLTNGTLNAFDNIHVYPLLCHLLNIQPNPNNGSLSTWGPFLKGASGAAVH